MDVQNRGDRETVRGSKGMPLHLTPGTAGVTYYLSLHENIVFVHTGAVNADGTCILWLPPVAEAAGLTFYICAPLGVTDKDVAVHVRETAAIHAKGDLDADDDHVAFFSDGVQWRVLIDGVA